MDTQYYKDHSVQVVFKAVDDIWIHVAGLG